MNELYSLFSELGLKMESHARKMKSVAAHPLSADKETFGQQDGEQLERIGRTGRVYDAIQQSFAMSTGDQQLWEASYTPFELSDAPNLDGLKVDAQVPDMPETLRQKWEQVDRTKAISVIKEMTQQVANKMVGELFAPYFVDGAQVNVTVLVNEILHTFKQNLEQLESMEGITIYDQPVSGRVVESVTRAYTLPFFLAIDAADDFDSGDCDKHIATSYRLGEEVKILAESGDMVLVGGQSDNYGWVDKNHVGRDHENAQAELETKHVVFYANPTPHFYRLYGEKRVIRPLDQLYVENDTIMTPITDNQGNWQWQEVPGLTIDDVTPQLDFSKPADLQHALDIMFATRMPYTLPVDDCSSFFQGFMRLGGKIVNRDSSGQRLALKELFDQSGQSAQFEVTEVDDLDQLKPGLYAVNQMMPDKEGNYNSSHIYIVHVEDPQHMTAFSQGFQLIGDTGVDTPVGPHVCGRPAFETHLQKPANAQGLKRKFAWTKLAA